jgi:hypothetical protein
MIDVLGHHYVGHQASGDDAFVDDVRWHWRLEPRLSLGSGPLAAHVTLHLRRAGRVACNADALERAAATVRRGLQPGTDHTSWKVRRQCMALALTLLAAVVNGCNELLDLTSNRLDVLFDGFRQQALLLGAEALAGGGEL